MIKLKSFFRKGQGPSGSRNASNATSSSSTDTITAGLEQSVPTTLMGNGSQSSALSSSLNNSTSISSLIDSGIEHSSKSGGKSSKRLPNNVTESKDKSDHLHYQIYKSLSPKDKISSSSKDGTDNNSILSLGEDSVNDSDFVLEEKQQSQNCGNSGKGKKISPITAENAHLINSNVNLKNQMHLIQQNVIGNNNTPLEQCNVNIRHQQHQPNVFNSDREFFNSDTTVKPQKFMLQELQIHLERLTKEKMDQENKISELASYQTEVMQLRNEIAKLQAMQENSNIEIRKLSEENETLRDRLRHVANSPLSDAEKHQIIQDSQRLHSSAPASIALPSNHETEGIPSIHSITPDWDKNSSSSEISVACLQDKIIQMEETHYSTNEELQATLQELADLQVQLSELQSDNERLSEEKDVLFQSLCRQTKKLEDSRGQIGTLQELLLHESNQPDIGTTEREQRLLDLLKSAQEERENLLIKHEELNSELNESRQSLEKLTTENNRLRERISLLDSTVDAANAERKLIESQLAQAKEDSSQKQIEVSRLSKLLENARSKIDEMEQDRAMGDKTDLGELLDIARKEKDILEGQVATLQEQLSKSQCEIQKLIDQLAGITEECKVTRNNAKCALSDLEYKYETLKQEKLKLCGEYQQLQESTNELQIQCKCHLEDKSQLESLLSETQRHLGEAERLLSEKEERLQKEIKQRKQEAKEWEQFQSDLLMTVRVANDFKTEAQSAREQLVIDNKVLRERIRILEQRIDKLNKQISTDAQQSLITTVQEMAARRQKVGNISRQDSRLSVKSLIESIENVNKQAKINAGPDSRCSSSSSLNSVTSDAMNNGNVIHHQGQCQQDGSIENRNNTTSECFIESAHKKQQNDCNTPVVTGLQNKGLLREQQPSTGANIALNCSQKSTTTGERKDPLNALVKNGGSKRNALLKWCQNKTVGYRNIDITNFSSSWNDGLAFCAILHSYLPDRVPYDILTPNNKRRNFSIAFSAAESVGIPTSLNINEMCQLERPDWTQIMAYVTAIYKHFET